MNSQKSTHISIVIPVYNEAANLACMLHDTLHVVNELQQPYECLVINDASTDQTAERLTQLTSSIPSLKVLTQPTNQGHGAAVRRGYQEARGRWVWQLDADEQFDPQYLKNLLAVNDSAALIIGTRQTRADPFVRRWLSACLRWLLRWRHGVRIRDANAPFRLYDGDWLRQHLRSLPANTLLPNVHLAIAAAREDSLTETTIPHRTRQHGKSTLGGARLWRFVFRGLRELLRPSPVISADMGYNADKPSS